MNTGGRSRPAPGELAVHRTDSGTEVVLELVGELDIRGIDRVEAAVADLPPHAHVTVDLKALHFMDSSGIRVFMNLDLRSRRDDWTLTLRSPQIEVMHVLQLCDFENRFDIIH